MGLNTERRAYEFSSRLDFLKGILLTIEKLDGDVGLIAKKRAYESSSR